MEYGKRIDPESEDEKNEEEVGGMKSSGKKRAEEPDKKDLKKIYIYIYITESSRENGESSHHLVPVQSLNWLQLVSKDCSTIDLVITITKALLVLPFCRIAEVSTF